MVPRAEAEALLCAVAEANDPVVPVREGDVSLGRKFEAGVDIANLGVPFLMYGFEIGRQNFGGFFVTDNDTLLEFGAIFSSASS